jgi:hypothetical protein
VPFPPGGLDFGGWEVFDQHSNIADAASEFFRKRVEHVLHDFDERFSLHARLLLQLSRDAVLPGRFVPLDSEHIGLAAHLAILDESLLRPCSGFNGGLVPFSATRALES